MSDVITKYRTLVERLYARTLSGNIKWRSDGSAVETTVGGSNIEVQSGQNQDYEPLIFLTVSDIYGKSLDNFTDETISGGPPGVSGFTTYYALMSSLHELAYRQATGADKVLDNILDVLDDNDDIPF